MHKETPLDDLMSVSFDPHKLKDFLQQISDRMGKQEQKMRELEKRTLSKLLRVDT